MSRWPLRTRLAAASAAAILVALALLGIAATLVVEDQLRGTVDRDLRRRAVDVAQLAALTPGLLEARGSLDLGSGGRQVWVEVRDRDGRIVARSDALRGRLLPGARRARRARREGRPRLRRRPARPRPDPALRGAAGRRPAAPRAAARSWSPRRWATSRTSSAGCARRSRSPRSPPRCSAGCSPPSSPAAGCGRCAASRSGARAISEAPDVGRRLPEPATRDEVGELSGALNRMLDALDHAREAERRLLADASHELRTPVTSLRGNAAFARRHGADDELLADLEADAERLSRLVEDLLALEREAGAELPAGEVDLEAVVGGGRHAAASSPRRPRRSRCAARPARSSGRCATWSRTPASTDPRAARCASR